MSLPPGDRVIINPTYVHGVGVQVKADAQQLLGPGSNSVQELHDTLSQLNGDKFPIQLYSTFYQFIEAHTNELTMLCKDRENIGDGLQDSATKAEETEIQTMASFNPEPNSTLGGPMAFPVYKQ